MAYIPWKPLLRIEERHSTEWITGGNGRAPFDTNEKFAYLISVTWKIF